MAQVALVEIQIKEGQTLIDRLTHEGITVTVAGWIRESDTEDWFLYLATPLVGADAATKPAYHRVNIVLRKMKKEGFGMDLAEIKVLSPHDPIAMDMISNRENRPPGSPTRFRGSRLGQLYVEEAYIYPPHPTVEESAGIQLWECGRIDLRPGIGPAGLCHSVVIDIETTKVVQKKVYRGTMANSQRPRDGHIEVIWAEGGAVRIIGPATGQRWHWSQPRATWEEGGCPPDEIQEAIFSAMG